MPASVQNMIILCWGFPNNIISLKMDLNHVKMHKYDWTSAFWHFRTVSQMLKKILEKKKYWYWDEYFCQPLAGIRAAALAIRKPNSILQNKTTCCWMSLYGYLGVQNPQLWITLWSINTALLGTSYGKGRNCCPFLNNIYSQHRIICHVWHMVCILL